MKTLDKSGKIADIYHLVNFLAKVTRQDLDQCLLTCNAGVTRLQYVVIRFLSHKHYTIRELSRRLSLEPATLVPVIDSLEKQGLVIRTNDPKDRRRNPLILTEEGLEVLNKVELIRPENSIVKGLDQLGPEKTVLLHDLLHEFSRLVAEEEEDLQDGLLSWQQPTSEN